MKEQLQELSESSVVGENPITPGNREQLIAWRKAARKRLIARRLAVPDSDHGQWSRVIHDYLVDGFRDVAGAVVSFYWPYQQEFDARPLILELLSRGAKSALPVVVQPKHPLVFRQWWPDAPMENGVYDIPVPRNTPDVTPDVVLLPVNGFDASGFRLGYGSGYFDRTLAVLPSATTSIGIGFEIARIDTIYPQPHDVPLTYIITERGIDCPGVNRNAGYRSKYFLPV